MSDHYLSILSVQATRCSMPIGRCHKPRGKYVVKGDIGTFMDLEEQYEKIYRYCYFRVHNQEIAEDITQESFLKFFKTNTSLDASKELPYLYTIARNLCIDYFRKREHEPILLDDIDTSYDPSDDLIESITIKNVISRLPKDEQEILLLRYVNEVPISSICKISGLSRFSVYRKIQKALKNAKEELEEGSV